MGLFAVLHPQKSRLVPTRLASNLSKNEKLAVTLAMHLVINRYGNRRAYPQEVAYIQAIQKTVLRLAEHEVAARRVADLDPVSILQAMPQAHKRYVATVFYQLAMLIQDPAVIGRASVVIRELGFSMADLADPVAFQPVASTKKTDPFFDRVVWFWLRANQG